MPAISSPYSALLRHAALAGDEPWLFQSEGLDWRWRSWRDAAAQAAASRERFASLPAGSRAPFLYLPSFEAVTLDLGIQGAGLFSMPVGEGAGEEPEGTKGTAGTAGTNESSEGGAVLMIEGTAVEVGIAGLMAMAERVEGVIAPPRKAGEREIVVLGGPLERPEERAMLSWATVTGAAVVLEPAPGMRVATAAWARPTVFHGTPEEIAVLRAWAGKARKRRRLPFGRLRTVLVTGGELSEEELAFWEGLGVKVAQNAFPNPK
ncbi:MAG TPA: hypothetical protein VF173_21375 [Thermoanaerobaculia bacterium]|nr:hypothetical protein [Thermoanaerobaculia bacterium]